MASSHRTNTSQSHTLKQLKNPRALQSHNNLCLISRNKLSGSQCHTVKGTLPNSPHENTKTGLPNCHDHNLTSFSDTHRHIPRTKSSGSLSCNTRHSLSNSQYHAVVQKHRQALPKLSLHTVPSQLHLRLNTSKDLRKLRVDGSPFQVM
jgi:hypothetical protein